jgi:UDP-galactopyranose mutase
MRCDVLVVGAGFAGAVCAERLASAGRRVLIIDKRDHIGGNAHDRLDAAGVRIHPYGPHIFHTQSARIFDYLSRFTAWRPYEHRVRARVEGLDVPFPINRQTLEAVFGLKLDETGAEALLESLRVPREKILTSEDVVLTSVGERLADLFFRNYTRKQWGLELSQLSPGVAARIPTRANDDDRYFTDAHQAMPKDGYATLFANMLHHPRITLALGTDFHRLDAETERDWTIYTGPIDAYFGCRLGALPYRSLRFDHVHLPGQPKFQPVGTVNYPGPEPYTRITEFKHLTGQDHSGTSIVYEHPRAEGDPYYPIPRPENAVLYGRYRALAQATSRTSFVGRLAEYKYFNMDQAVGSALATVAHLLGEPVSEVSAA